MLEKLYPKIIAHKGSSVEAYPNSIAAFNLAINQKADMIELDTHLTSDGVFIINHDKGIEYEGMYYRISKTPFKTIEKISLPNGEEVPILEEVLDNMLSKIRFNVEIKCAVKKRDFDILLNNVGQDNSRIIVSSFRRDVLFELKSTSLEYKLAFVFRNFNPLSITMSNQDFIHSLHPSHRFLSSKTVNRFHKKNKEVNTWTVNKKNRIRKLVQMGVDGIITDNPSSTREIIETIK